MTNALATTNTQADIVERVVIAGDLSRLQPLERVEYYRATCESLGLNPLTKPFDYITLNNKLTLYATRTATDQLRSRNSVSIKATERAINNDLGVYTVEVEARTPDGRSDFATGVVNIAGLRGDALANALMKAETKAKRRATLSICGLGWMDESELETVPAARRTTVDTSTGEIRDVAPDAGPPASDKQRGFIAGLQDKLGWSSEQFAIYAKEHKIDLVALSKAEASYLIEQLQLLATESTTATQPADDLAQLAESVKKLRECERTVTTEPPAFTWNKKQGRLPLEDQYIASRMRLYAWLREHTVADSASDKLLPDLAELDDQGLMDLAYAAAGL